MRVKYPICNSEAVILSPQDQQSLAQVHGTFPWQ